MIQTVNLGKFRFSCFPSAFQNGFYMWVSREGSGGLRGRWEVSSGFSGIFLLSHWTPCWCLTLKTVAGDLVVWFFGWRRGFVVFYADSVAPCCSLRSIQLTQTCTTHSWLPGHTVAMPLGAFQWASMASLHKIPKNSCPLPRPHEIKNTQLRLWPCPPRAELSLSLRWKGVRMHLVGCPSLLLACSST